MSRKTLSVIIPCLNEEKRIGSMLEDLLAKSERCEIIVVDGGSNDNTVSIASGFQGVTVLTSKHANRAIQMNLGARYSNGDILLFLHADTTLPGDYYKLVRSAFEDPDIIGGAFALTFDHEHWMFKVMAVLTRWNIKWITVGDHALFFKREVFSKLGGYPEIPLLEDLELQLKARKMGKMVRIQTPVVTSARRFTNNGVLRQTFKDAWILSAYYAGVSPFQLAHQYSDQPHVAR